MIETDGALLRLSRVTHVTYLHSCFGIPASRRRDEFSFSLVLGLLSFSVVLSPMVITI